MEIPADILHFHELFTIRMAIRYKKKYAAKIIYDVHEDFSEIVRTFSRRVFLRREISARLINIFEKWMVPKCDAIVTVEPVISNKFETAKNDINEIRNYPIDSLKKSLSLDLKKKILEFKGDDYLMVYAGQIAKERELELGIDTCQLLKKEYGINMKLVLIGPGPDDYIEKLQKMGKKTGLAAYFPPILHEQVQSFFSLGDLGWNILPYRKVFMYSLPNKSYEFLQAGIPFISSDMEMLREAVHHKKAGIIIKNIEAGVIAAAIHQKLNNENDFLNQPEKYKKIYSENYRWANEAEKLVDLYRRLEKE